MNLNRGQFWGIALACLMAGPLAGQDGLPTLAEAAAISKKTGRPIFAVAGQKT